VGVEDEFETVEHRLLHLGREMREGVLDLLVGRKIVGDGFDDLDEVAHTLFRIAQNIAVAEL
jgi:hypothetical protein